MLLLYKDSKNGTTGNNCKRTKCECKQQQKSKFSHKQYYFPTDNFIFHEHLCRNGLQKRKAGIQMYMTFLCGTSYSPSDWEEDIEVTEEEYERLTTAMETGKDFYDCEEVKDIYNRIYDIIDKSATSDLLAYDEDIQKKYGNDADFKASDLYSIFIQFLEEE